MVRRERGQLLLAGSLVIALLVIGLAVLLNSVVFTENVSGGSSVEVTGDINEFNREMRRNARVLTIRINHAGNYSTIGEIEDDLRANYTEYSRVLAESYADTGSIYVNVTFDKTLTEGRRVTQEGDVTFENGGSDTWEALSGRKTLGWFVINVNVSETKKTDRARIAITNTTGSTYTISVQQSPGGKLLVNSTLDGRHTSNVTCTPTGGRVVIDVIDGTSFTGDCAVNGSQLLSGSYDSIRFEHADAATGRFTFVVNGTAGVSVQDCASTGNPCRMPAAWEIEMTSQYETVALSYSNSQNVTIYQSS